MRAAAFLFLAACGGAAPVVTSTIALEQGLVASDIGAYRVSVIAPLDKKGAHLTHADGSPLTCADFLADQLPASTLVLYADGTFTLDPNDPASRTHDLKVPPGAGDWVLGEAFASADAYAKTVARACTNNVTVQPGKVTNVPLDFYPCVAGPVDNPRLTCQ